VGELAEALGLSAVEAWGIAREIRQHLEADRVTEGRLTTSSRERPHNVRPPLPERPPCLRHAQTEADRAIALATCEAVKAAASLREHLGEDQRSAVRRAFESAEATMIGAALAREVCRDLDVRAVS